MVAAVGSTTIAAGGRRRVGDDAGVGEVAVFDAGVGVGGGAGVGVGMGVGVELFFFFFFFFFFKQKRCNDNVKPGKSSCVQSRLRSLDTHGCRSGVGVGRR